jgi:hypothetical protein
MSQHNDVNIPDISRGDARWLDIIQSEDARRIYSGNVRAEHGLARLEIRDAEKTSPLGSTLGSTDHATPKGLDGSNAATRRIRYLISTDFPYVNCSFPQDSTI